MGWELNIPKILHVYWGGGPLYYLRYVTVKTFIKHNPDWEIRLYYPEYPNKNITWRTGENNHPTQCKDFTEELMGLPITTIPIDFTEFGFTNDMPEVHKSDFIRLQRLSTIGGVWSDMDIFYFKSMEDLYLNTPENKDIETFYCNHKYGHSIGFLMSRENNQFFKHLTRYSKIHYHPGNYQAIGVLIWNRYFSSQDSINTLTPAINFDMDVVYAHDVEYLSEILEPAEPRFTEKSIGLHWYGGASMWTKFANETNGGMENLPDTIIGNLLKTTL